MQGLTNVQRQHSTYFPPTILQPKGKKRGNSQMCTPVGAGTGASQRLISHLSGSGSHVE